MVWRGLLAGLVISLVTAGAVSASVLLQLREVIHQLPPGVSVPELNRSQPGKPQTLLILGSDRRFGDAARGEPPRADTMLLVRLDPSRDVVALMSIPRDLLTDVPGAGNGVKINSAYAVGGERETVRVVKRLLSAGGTDFQVNHVITVDFTGFRRAIDYVGCVYTDVDRRYFNDQGGPGGYAVIDIQPGYQKLCGSDALAYVRYRHGDNDLLRAARQQDFLRAARNAQGVLRLRREALSLGGLQELARVFGRYFDHDASLDSTKEVIRLAKALLQTAGKPIREVRFRVSDAPDHVNLVASRSQLEASVREFLAAKASATPRTGPSPGTKPARPSHRSHATGLVADRTQGENIAILAARKAGFPFYFPTLQTEGASYQEPRVYTLKDEAGRVYDAYRLVLSTGLLGEYYGIQGTTWPDPPILDDPHDTVRRGGRTLLVYRDGKRTRLVAWRTSGAVYWVSNTLTHSLTNGQMLAIAGSLHRLGK